MVDELEKLLEEEQEEGELFWLLSAGRLWRDIVEGDSGKNDVVRGSTYDEEASVEGVDARGNRIVVESEGEKPAEAMRTRSGEVDLVSAMRRGNYVAGELGLDGEERVWTLYRGLMQGRQAAGYRRRSRGDRVPLVREAVQPAMGRRDVLQVDRAFQRDARRYDGGFTWQ